MLQMFEIDDRDPFTCWIFQNIFLLNKYHLNGSFDIRLLQSNTIFKQRNNYEVSFDLNFCMKYFTTPNPEI